MKLLYEINEAVQTVIEEEANGKRNLFLEGIFIQADLKNRNGRVYPSTVMENEVVRFTKELIDENRAVGELNHPQGPQINLDRISHKIVSLKKDGTNYMGRAAVLETPCGKVVRGLLEGGVQLGVSTRGLGSLKETKDGLMEVQNDFRLIAVDCVSDPSGPDCFVMGIMENVEYFYGPDGSIQSRVANDVKNAVKKMSKTELEETKLRIFEYYMNSLKNK